MWMDPPEAHYGPHRSPFSAENLTEYDLPPDSMVATEEHPDLLVMKAVRQSGRDRALVLYNPQEHSFSVHSSKSVDVCPLCQRAFESKASSQGNFANKNYFTLLARANALAKAQQSSVLPDCRLGDAGLELPAAPAASPAASSSSTASRASAASPTPSPCRKPRSPLSGHRARTPPPLESDFMLNADPLSEENTNSEYYKRFFIQGKKLGSGGYGGVWMCRHVLQGFDLGTYAVKKVPIGTDRNWLLRVLQEVKALERLHRHPNIIEYHHSWIEYDQPADFGPKVPCLFILMDYADHGTLEEYCHRRMISGEDEIWWHSISLCYALQHLHSNCILHRDVKPLNVLLASSNLQFPNVLLSDLGEAMQVMQRRNQRSGCTGTLEYCAPELLLEDEAGNLLVNHDFSSDMWGLGLIMYYMCFRRLPYREDVDVVQEIRAAGIRAFDIPKVPKYSKELVNLMRMLLSPKPSDRPLPAHILRNSYVRRKWQSLTDDLTTQSLDKDPSLERGTRAPSSGGLEDFKLNPMQLDPSVVDGPPPILAPSPHKLPGLPMITGPDNQMLVLYGAAT